MPSTPLRTIVHSLAHAAAQRVRRAFRGGAARERTLRVGVDIRPFYEPLTGIGWYLYFLLHELARHDDVELVLLGDARVTDEGPRLHAQLPPNAELLVFDFRGQPPSRLARPLSAAAYVAWIELAGIDVFFGANYFLPRLHSAVARRRVVTVHDLTYKRFPELLQQETLDNLDAHMPREIAASDAVICVSESTRRDLLRYYPIDAARAVTVHSGIAPRIAGAPVEGLPSRYILFVSTIEPRKNLGVLLDAFDALRERYDGWLVVVGKIGWKSEQLRRRLDGDRILHLDYLDAARLATVYAHAEVFVMPSIYEGFGFPVLEAMAHDVPVIAARSSSLPEIGGNAALYFEPHDAAGLERQLARVTEEAALRKEMVARGRARLAAFDWRRAADETLAVLRRVSGI